MRDDGSRLPAFRVGGLVAGDGGLTLVRQLGHDGVGLGVDLTQPFTQALAFADPTFLFLASHVVQPVKPIEAVNLHKSAAAGGISR